MKVAIGADHAGYELKAYIIEKLANIDVAANNHGTDGPESVDYPDYGHAVCEEVVAGVVDFGILICGSANGMTMTANKHQEVRCGLCWLPEIAELTKQHNNANVIALPARFISNELGWEIVQAYMNAEYEGGRHQRRVDKILCS
jgi:ribose 5-phosphate isomerase B